DHISAASCSTHPGCGKCCVNSRWATARMAPAWSNSIARELVVPWSIARIKFSIQTPVFVVWLPGSFRERTFPGNAKKNHRATPSNATKLHGDRGAASPEAKPVCRGQALCNSSHPGTYWLQGGKIWMQLIQRRWIGYGPTPGRSCFK